MPVAPPFPRCNKEAELTELQGQIHVLDQDLPPWVPIPPIAEVQAALERAVGVVIPTENVKSIMRTGTLVTTGEARWS